MLAFLCPSDSSSAKWLDSFVPFSPFWGFSVYEAFESLLSHVSPPFTSGNQVIPGPVPRCGDVATKNHGSLWLAPNLVAANCQSNDSNPGFLSPNHIPQLWLRLWNLRFSTFLFSPILTSDFISFRFSIPNSIQRLIISASGLGHYSLWMTQWLYLSSNVLATVIIPILQLGKLRLREVK